MKRLPSQLWLVLILFAIACNSKQENNTKPSSMDVYQDYISGVTSGVIKRNDPILIKFTTDLIAEEEKGNKLGKSILSFSPSIEGTATWVSTDAIEFKPFSPFEWGKKYTGKLELAAITQVPENLNQFNFTFQLPAKEFSVAYSGLTISGAGEYQLTGEITTSDVMGDSEIEKVIQAQQEGKNLSIEWEHNALAYQHLFAVKNIKRKDEESTITLTWNGKSIDAENSSNKVEITIPSLRNFNISSAKVINSPDQIVEIVFSDPIHTEKDFRGFFQIDKTNLTSYKIIENRLILYPTRNLTGVHTLKINGAIESTLGYKLGKERKYTLNFGGIKPQVKMLGNGVIVPQSDGLYFPFEAVSLNAVDVRITKIFTNNIHSFLQDNDLNYTYRLNRVGRVIHRSKVDLSAQTTADLNSWNAFNLDLAELIEIEAGAIYNVEIGFRKDYSLFACESEQETTNEFVPIEEEANFEDQEYSRIFWRYYYDWRKRDDACSQAYFSPDKFIQRNILGSNFGIIAKLTPKNETYIYLTNLLTADPIAGVSVELYDYQNQAIGTGTTNSEGMLRLQPEREPFLLVARKNEMVGYLKIDNSTSQSTSNFDVAGKKVQKGLKGFIYGERDVWRPGDSVFVSFILEDRLNTLPDGHPLILEIYNSKGQFVKKLVKQKSSRSIYPFFFKTNTEDPTGNWQIKVRAGAVVFPKTVRIETVKPNRLKIDIQFNNEQLSAQHSSSGQLEARWLHGTPAKEMKAKVDVTFQPYTPTFPNFKKFDFSTPYSRYNGEQKTIFDQKLNDEGKADITFSYQPNTTVSGFLKAIFTTKVFEKGGDFSITTFSKPFSPYPNYVGLKIEYSYKNWNKLDNNKQHTVEVATVDENGSPVNLNNVEVKLFKLDYHWWYDNNRENLASYAGKTYHKPVLSKSIQTIDGKGTFVFPKDENRWGRHLLLVSSPNGHVSGQVIYFGYPWGRNKQKGGAQVLALVTEQEKYQVGDEITVSFPANPEAKALITYENGSGIIGEEWLTDLSEFTHHTFTARPEMAPNIYVYVTLIQPHAQTSNDLPIRLYGVVPIMVEDAATRLYPEITMPDELRPHHKFTIGINEKNQRAMDYTIAIVDEGLLDITNFKTPAPWNSFYAREALGVRSYDLYNYVMGSFGSRLESMFAVGGSDGLTDNSKKKSERFKPVVKVLGPFHLEANQKTKHQVTLPQYVGAVRTMVIAANNGTYGHADVSTPVREPLMVLATMPRVLSPQEKVDLPVSVFAMKPEVKEVEIKITSNDYLTVLGRKDTTITFEELGEKDIFFQVQSNSKIGVAKLKVEVRSGKEKSFHEIELDIREPNLPTVQSSFKLLLENESWETTLNPFGTPGTNKASVEISAMPPLNLGKRLNYLIRYPHGCVEQTTSSVFPQIYLPLLLQLDQQQLDHISYNVSTGIEKLQRFQHSSGGFSYWQGSYQVSDWASCYAGHFLLEAEKAGFLVPGNVKSQWLKYIRKEAAEFTVKDTERNYVNYLQAYRLYLLALEGEAQISAMNRLKATSYLDNQTEWLLAASYALAGMKDVAFKLVDFRNTTPDKAYKAYYGSQLRDESVILMAQLAMGEIEQASKMALQISKKLSQNTWHSTQSTAFGLISLAQFGNVSGVGNDYNYTLKVNEKAIQGSGQQLIQQTELDFDNEKAQTIQVKNNGGSAIFVTIAQEGIKAGVDTESFSKGVQLVVNYFETNGKKLNPQSITQGKDFKATVSVYNSTGANVENIALSQLFPAGWEIINARLFEDLSVKNSSFDYQDIRDDRVHTYFELAGFETKTFTINLNATYTGEYLLAPVTCGAMYDNTFFAKTPGMKVKVIKQ